MTTISENPFTDESNFTYVAMPDFKLLPHLQGDAPGEAVILEAIAALELNEATRAPQPGAFASFSS